MSTMGKRLEALEAKAGTGQSRIVIGEDPFCLYLLEQPDDEPEEAFREHVRGLWLKDGADPAGMPVFDWGTGEKSPRAMSGV